MTYRMPSVTIGRKSNAERQKRWREKNRALYNLRRRNARRKNLLVDVQPEPKAVVHASGRSTEIGEARESTTEQADRLPPLATNSSAFRSEKSDSRGGQTSTIEALRKLVESVQNEPAVPVAKPAVFRDDYGRVISEEQYMEVLRKKAEADRKGYEIYEYGQ